ncbi:hypothetical protein [Picosynechococcus sp. NKBG15041c]|uniref:hypothetical protein n=1 Tax=Picosynechococcus sp. NKBG15041c TaxID=1407650 RepID=UPI001F2A13F7|nr:hypothetical protein [Picosynechococcus sp. NKBG15041c]
MNSTRVILFSRGYLVIQTTDLVDELEQHRFSHRSFKGCRTIAAPVHNFKKGKTSMSLLNLQFRATASRLQVLDNSHPDLAFSKVNALVQTHLSRELEKVIAHRQDPEDPHTLWELLKIDAVLRLENQMGENIRVGVYLVPNEFQAYKALQTANQAAYFQVRRQLGIQTYWVLCLDPKHFPSQNQWIDFLYGEIDRQQKGCRLIFV